MYYYKVTHKYKLINHYERKLIGMYRSLALAEDAVNQLKTAKGFSTWPNGFKIKKVFRLKVPKLLDKTFWEEGFTTYSVIKNRKRPLSKKDEERLKNSFSFLFEEYGFEFARADLGNAVDRNGKFFFYGPVYCYYIFSSNICINILNLVQRQDYEIYITKDLSADQAYIRNGILEEDKYSYNWNLFAEHMKNELATKGEIYNTKIIKR